MWVLTSLKSLDVGLILARNCFLLPCWSAADTFPTAHVNEENKEPCSLWHRASSLLPQRKKYEEKTLVSGPFTLLNRKVCRGGATRPEASSVGMCTLRGIKLKSNSETDTLLIVKFSRCARHQAVAFLSMMITSTGWNTTRLQTAAAAASLQIHREQSSLQKLTVEKTFPSSTKLLKEGLFRVTCNLTGCFDTCFEPPCSPTWGLDDER